MIYIPDRLWVLFIDVIVSKNHNNEKNSYIHKMLTFNNIIWRFHQEVQKVSIFIKYS